MRVVKPGARVRASRLALVVMSAAVAVSGCHVPGTSSGQGNSGPLTVGVVPGIDNSPLYVGMQQGLFRGQGLDVVIKTYSSLRPELQALKSGRIDVAAGDYADFFYQQAVGGASLHLVADGYDAAPSVMEVLALPGSGITTPQQLVHKVVATPEPQLIASDSSSYLTDVVPYSMETLATQAVLASDGIAPTSVTWKAMPVQDMIHALATKHVSAILATEPYIFAAESQLGAVEVMDSCSGPTANLPLSGYFSLSGYASAHDGQLRQFQAALASAQANAGAGGPLQTALPRFTGMTTQDAALSTYGTFPISLSVGQVSRVADLMYESGLISSPLDLGSMLGH